MYVIFVIILIIILLLLKIGLNIKIKDLKKVKQIAYNKENNKLIKDVPSNKQICREILEMLGNAEVKVEDSKDEKSKTSAYLVMQNKIIIANIDETFTRIQTIAHECIHSIQNKVMLKFNFIISNINMVYFLIISILTLIGKIDQSISKLLLIILIALEFVSFVIRNSLEIDAMTRAEGLSQEYIEKVVDKQTKEKIMDKYKNLNKIGIKLYTYMLTIKLVIKPIIYCLLCCILI